MVNKNISQNQTAISDVEHLQKKIADLENRIAETKERLPAHSAKPAIMMELFKYEDELDVLNDSLKKMLKK